MKAKSKSVLTKEKMKHIEAQARLTSDVMRVLMIKIEIVQIETGLTIRPDSKSYGKQRIKFQVTTKPKDGHAPQLVKRGTLEQCIDYVLEKWVLRKTFDRIPDAIEAKKRKRSK